MFAQLSEKQKKDIAVLNYMTYLSYDIEAHKKDRLYLENIYNQLENNVLEDRLDEGTADRVIKMRDQIYNFRMIEIQRERIEYLNENRQSQAIKSAIPDPLYILTLVQSGNPLDIAMSLVATTISSVSNYSTAKNDASIEYLQSGWELDDKEMETLHKLSQGALEYKYEYVRDNKVNALDTLTNKMLENFAKESQKTNLSSKISFFEREESKRDYKYFGLYYLELVKAYYELGEYEKCLESIEQYIENNIRIFRKDYEYSKVLPLVMVAAQKVYPRNYERYIEKFLFEKNPKSDINLTVKYNTQETDWEIRYFTAQTCIQLYSKTGNKKYLEEAYTLTFDAVRKYTDVQKQLAAKYFAPIITPPNITSSNKKIIAQRKKERQTELFPISEALLLNCDLLYALAEKLQKDESEMKKINNILSDAFEFPSLTQTYVSKTENISKPLDTLLNDLVYDTNAGLSSHSDDFKESFIKEYKNKYKEIILAKFAYSNGDQIEELSNKARTTEAVTAVWNTDNEFVVPGNYLGETSRISVTINELKPNTLSPSVIKFENVSFKVDKIKKGKDERDLSEWSCYISFIDDELRKYKYDSKNNYSVTVDILTGKTELSFVYFSKKTLTGITFEQVSDLLLSSAVENSAFKFPEITYSEWSGKDEIYSKEVDELVSNYILGSVTRVKENSEEFQKAFIKEYKPVYFNQIKEILGVSSEEEILSILQMDKSSSEIFASIDGTTITLPANLIYTNSLIGLDLIEDDVKVCSKMNIPYKKSNKVKETKVEDTKEEVSEIEIDFDELKKYKFDSKKNYRINLFISSEKKTYSIVFVRVQYKTLKVLKTQRFVTLSQYLSETIVNQMEENDKK